MLTLAAEFSFWDVVWWIFLVFALAVWLYLLVLIFTDLWHRDLSGWAKAAWVIGVLLLPLLGVLLYMVARPKPTAAEIEAEQEKQRAQLGMSTAEELELFSKLHDQGKLTDEEFAAQKRKLLG